MFTVECFMADSSLSYKSIQINRIKKKLIGHSSFTKIYSRGTIGKSRILVRNRLLVHSAVEIRMRPAKYA